MEAILNKQLCKENIDSLGSRPCST